MHSGKALCEYSLLCPPKQDVIYELGSATQQVLCPQGTLSQGDNQGTTISAYDNQGTTMSVCPLLPLNSFQHCLGPH